MEPTYDSEVSKIPSGASNPQLRCNNMEPKTREELLGSELVSRDIKKK